MLKKSKFTHKLFFLSPLLLIWIGTMFIDLEKDEHTAKDLLLPRSEKIQLGIEWQQTQTLFNQYCNQLRKEPSNADARLGLVRIFIQEARVTGEHGHYYPAALKQIDKILEVKNLDQEIEFMALTLQSGVLLSLHEFQSAKKVAEQAIKINPYNAQIHGSLVDCYVELGEYDQAIAMADQMIQIRPDLRSYARISYLREIYGQNQEAKKALELAIAAGYPGQEETAWTMLTLADFHLQLNELTEAEILYHQILAERSNYPFAVAGLGEVAKKRGQYGLAEQYLTKAIEIIPEVGFYISLAELYKTTQKNERFQKLFPEILDMLQDDTDAGHNMNMEYANIYLHLAGDPQKALEYANREYLKRPNNIDVRRMLATICLELGQEEMAKTHLEIAMSTGSKHPQLQELKDQLL